MSRLHKHFNTAIAPPVVSQEGILDETIKKVRAVFKRAPMNFSADQGRMISQHHQVIGKEVTSYVKKHFPAGVVPKGMELRSGEIASGEIVERLAYRGKFDAQNPIEFLERALKDIKQTSGPFCAEIEFSRKRVDSIDANLKRELGTIYNKHRVADWVAEGDPAPQELSDQVRKIINTASDEVKAQAIKPFAKFPKDGIHWLGNQRTIAGKPAHANSLYPVELKLVADEKVALPSKLPALNAEQIKGALALINAYVGDHLGFLADGVWLDHSDGHPVHDQLEEIGLWDYLLDSSYYDYGYIQTIWDLYDPGLPLGQDPSDLLVLGLLTWIDRSIAK